MKGWRTTAGELVPSKPTSDLRWDPHTDTSIGIKMRQIAANWQMVQKIEAEHYVISTLPLFLLLQHLTHHLVALHPYGAIEFKSI